ncbi:hypothetical protein PA07A_0168 [Cutibacterium acnes P07A]|nr:hypothetical protein [Cutibacterium acnes P07A]
MTSQPRNSRRIARLRSNSRRILTITTISSIRSKAIIRTPSTHKTGTNTPRAAMVGEARVLPPGWSQPAGQYEGWNGQYPQQGWDGQNPQQGWDPTQYPQQGWQTGQNPQGWDSHQGWDPNLQGWDGQPGAQIDDVQSTPAAAIGQGDVDNLQNDPNYYFDSNGERGPGWYGPSGAFFPATQAYESNAQPDLSYMAEGTPAGTTGTDHEHISEPVGGIPFSDAPQPTRKSQYWIIAVAAILVVAIGAGVFFYLRSKSGATKAVPATASKPAASASKSPTPEVTVTSTSTATAGATSVAPASATPMPSVPNDASTTPSPDLVRQLFNAPDAQVQWVSLAADGQNAAVAYASTFNINGKSAGPNGGHLVMRKNGSHWEPLSQGGVIVDDNDCDAMLKTLGDKAAVAASQVMNNKQCDAAIVYDLAKASPIRLGEMAGVGPLNLDKSTSELASTIHVIPDGVGDGCTRNPTAYSRYGDLLGGVWTQGGKAQAYLFTGGNNATSNGARIGITEAQLRSDYSKLKLTDVSTEFSGIKLGFQKALAYSYHGKEIDYLFNGGKVVAYMIRNSDFSPTTC